LLTFAVNSCYGRVCPCSRRYFSSPRTVGRLRISRGLKGKEIPLLARITAITDAFEVMVNGRPYKKPFSVEEATVELKKCAGTQFDPELVELFYAVLQEIKEEGEND